MFVPKRLVFFRLSCFLSINTLKTLFLLFLTVASLFAEPVPDGLYEERKEHDPNGIGKFFMGREIAMVMGHQAAPWLERPEREEEERTDLLIKALALKDGEVAADIGAGTGYLTERMAREVGAKGLVYGVDIQQEMLDLMMRKMAMKRIKNVKQVLGDVADPKLPVASCDLIILVDVYHELEQPYEMVRNMIPALKKGGRLVLVEFRGEDPKVPIKLIHKMTEMQVKKELALHSELEWQATHTELPQQHIITFVRK